MQMIEVEKKLPVFRWWHTRKQRIKALDEQIYARSAAIQDLKTMRELKIQEFHEAREQKLKMEAKLAEKKVELARMQAEVNDMKLEWF